MENSQPWIGLLGAVQPLLRQAPKIVLMTEEGLPLDSSVVPYFMLRGHLKSIASVVADVSLLLEHGQYGNLIGLARIAFESRVHVFATLANPEYAAEKVLNEVEQGIKDIDGMLANDEGIDPQFARLLQEERAHLVRIRANFEGTRNRKWTIKEAADAAGLGVAYAERYSLLSQAAHCTPNGLASKDDIRLIALSMIRLLDDVIAVVGSLLFCLDRATGERRPAVLNWKDILPSLEELHTRYAELHQQANSQIVGLSFAE